MIVANQNGLVVASSNDGSDVSQYSKPGYFVLEGFALAGTVLTDIGTGTGEPDVPYPPSEAHTEYNELTGMWAISQYGLDRMVSRAWSSSRAERDRLLVASDWTQLPDVPLATKEAWATYRQALRDITNQTDPFNIVWPVAP